MRNYLIILFLALAISPSLFLGSGCSRGVPAATEGPDISLDYLAQARYFRNEGRYELARQSYAQALATCKSNANLAIIEHELAGCELLIRTMR